MKLLAQIDPNNTLSIDGDAFSGDQVVGIFRDWVNKVNTAPDAATIARLDASTALVNQAATTLGEVATHLRSISPDAAAS